MSEQAGILQKKYFKNWLQVRTQGPAGLTWKMLPIMPVFWNGGL